jgi:excisionase family DNA binding protein
MTRRQEPLTLTEVAERLGVHYMTAYRYVRTGRLAATKVGHEWVVSPGEVAAFERASARPKSARRGARRAAYPSELRNRLLAGDESGAWRVVELALGSGMDPDEVVVGMMAPALTEIGDQWASGDVTVGQEHQASGVAARLLARLGPRFTRRGRTRGRILLGAAPFDDHGLPTAMLRDLLRGRGFSVSDLGANVPAGSWADFVDEAERGSPGLVAVGVCATTGDNEVAVASAISAIHAVTATPIVLGGLGVRSATDARRLGADRYTTSLDDAVDVFEEIADAR